MNKKFLEGKLLSYSEQGMEGGELCIQDINQIKLADVTSPYLFSSNIKVWDKKNTDRFGTASNPEFLIDNNWLDYIDPIRKDADYEISSLNCGELNGDLEADKRLSEKYNFQIKYSVERLNETYGIGNWKLNPSLPNIILKDGIKVHFGGHPITFPQRPYGIPKNAQSRISIQWDDGIIEHKKLTKELLIEKWDYKGLHKLVDTDFLKVFALESKKIIYEGRINEIPLKIFSSTFKGHFDQINNGSLDWERYFIEKHHAELYREEK